MLAGTYLDYKILLPYLIFKFNWATCAGVHIHVFICKYIFVYTCIFMLVLEGIF
jgi:hypothetical protein